MIASVIPIKRTSDRAHATLQLIASLPVYPAGDARNLDALAKAVAAAKAMVLAEQADSEALR